MAKPKVMSWCPIVAKQIDETPIEECVSYNSGYCTLRKNKKCEGVNYYPEKKKDNAKADTKKAN